METGETALDLLYKYRDCPERGDTREAALTHTGDADFTVALAHVLHKAIVEATRGRKTLLRLAERLYALDGEPGDAWKYWADALAQTGPVASASRHWVEGQLLWAASVLKYSGSRATECARLYAALAHYNGDSAWKSRHIDPLTRYVQSAVRSRVGPVVTELCKGDAEVAAPMLAAVLTDNAVPQDAYGALHAFWMGLTSMKRWPEGPVAEELIVIANSVGKYFPVDEESSGALGRAILRSTDVGLWLASGYVKTHETAAKFYDAAETHLKSGNDKIRAAAEALARRLAEFDFDERLAASLKNGKTASPAHRLAIWHVLGGTENAVLNDIAPLVSKETSEPVAVEAVRSVRPCDALVPLLKDSRASVRRAALAALAEASLLSGQKNGSVVAHVQVQFKASVSNALTAGPLEASIAVALGAVSLAESQSFVSNEKFVHKVCTLGAADEWFFAKALEAVALNEISPEERENVAASTIALVLASKVASTHQAVADSLRAQVAKYPLATCEAYVAQLLTTKVWSDPRFRLTKSIVRLLAAPVQGDAFGRERLARVFVLAHAPQYHSRVADTFWLALAREAHVDALSVITTVDPPAVLGLYDMFPRAVVGAMGTLLTVDPSAFLQVVDLIVDGFEQNETKAGLLLVKCASLLSLSTAYDEWTSLFAAYISHIDDSTHSLFDAFSQAVYLLSSGLDVFTTALLAVCIHRVYGASVPEGWTAESLDSQVERLLLHLRLMAEGTRFSSLTLVAILPLLRGVLYSQHSSEEMLTLALDVLALHRTDPVHRRAIAGDIVYALTTHAALTRAASQALIEMGNALGEEYERHDIGFSEAAFRQEARVYMDGLFCDSSPARLAVLQALNAVDLTDLSADGVQDATAATQDATAATQDTSAAIHSSSVLPLFIARHDPVDRLAQLADEIWLENALNVGHPSPEDVLPFLSHPSRSVRVSVADAIGELARTDITAFWTSLIALYQRLLDDISPRKDEFGFLVEYTGPPNDDARSAVALALMHVAQAAGELTPEHVISLFSFIMDHGAQTVVDPHAPVRQQWMTAATTIIDVQGHRCLDELVALFENALANKGDQKAPKTAKPKKPKTLGLAKKKGEGSETVKKEKPPKLFESVIVLLGRTASHFALHDPRVKTVMGQLLQALKTPHEAVQAAVAECVVILMRREPSSEAHAVVDTLIQSLLSAPAENVSEARGAAYGLAGTVKARGLSLLARFGIIEMIHEKITEGGEVNERIAVVTLVGVLGRVLGRLFEPYFIYLLDDVLAAFNDSNSQVRSLAQDAAAKAMGQLSTRGVSLILPTIHSRLQDTQWRSKKAAIEMLGAMANLAPAQLSTYLPTIVPPLTLVLTDTHKHVKDAASASLQRFGDVVKTPEINAIQQSLLDAFVEPNLKTMPALREILAINFTHVIDSSSLALIVPILDRGLRDRHSSDSRRLACAIVGSLASLVDPDDLTPHLAHLVPLVQSILVDPIPDVRATSAGALGQLVEQLGETAFPNLLDDLLAVLQSRAIGIDQQGAAQAVAEIVARLPSAHFDDLLRDALDYLRSPFPYVREGYMSLLVYLPITLGDRFIASIPRVVHPLVHAFADESDGVREASQKASRFLVTRFLQQAKTSLLPVLELGLFDTRGLVRATSINLVTDIIFRLLDDDKKSEKAPEAFGNVADQDEIDAAAAGVNPDNDDDEEPVTVAPRSSSKMQKLVDLLGRSRRDSLFAALCIVRFDALGSVRLKAVNTWKQLVANTSVFISDILPSLIDLVVRILGNTESGQRIMAVSCLAETCHKLGETVFGRVINALAGATESTSVAQNQGVCIALAELIPTMPRNHILAQESGITHIARRALVHPDSGVRAAAARAFDALQQHTGVNSVDDTLDRLLSEALAQGSNVEAGLVAVDQESQEAPEGEQEAQEPADSPLSALIELTRIQPSQVLAKAVPQLCSPVSLAGALILKHLIPLTGDALGDFVVRLTYSLRAAGDVAAPAIDALLATASNYDTGLDTLHLHLLGLSNAKAPADRISACALAARYFAVNSSPFHDRYRLDWIRIFISFYTDADVAPTADTALVSLINNTPKPDRNALVIPARRALEALMPTEAAVPYVSQGPGLKALVPLIVNGLLTGSAEQREQAAYAVQDILARTTPEAFKPHCVPTVGPMIRIVGDRVPPPVKIAILTTLASYFEAVPLAIKPFFPQLQRTFVRSLADTSSSTIRNRAAFALGALMGHQPLRVDALVSELLDLYAKADNDETTGTPYLTALSHVVTTSGASLNPQSVNSIAALLPPSAPVPPSESLMHALAKVAAALLTHHATSIHVLLASVIKANPPTQFASICLMYFVTLSSPALHETSLAEPAASAVARFLQSDVGSSVTKPAREAHDYMQHNWV